MAAVYVIFSSLDRRLVELLSSALGDHDHRVLNNEIDSNSAAPAGGNARYSQTSTLIAQAEIVLVLLTVNASNSVLVNREVALAIAQGQILLPIRFDGSGIPATLAAYHAFDARGLDQATLAARLDAVIREYTRAPEATARLQVPSPAPSQTRERARAEAPAIREAKPNAQPSPSLRPTAAPAINPPIADVIPSPPPPPQSVPMPSPAQPSSHSAPARKASIPIAPLALGVLALLLIVAVVLISLNGFSLAGGLPSPTENTLTLAARGTPTNLAQATPTLNQNTEQLTATSVVSATDLAPTPTSAPDIAAIVAATAIALRATDESSISPAEAAILASGAAIRADQSQQTLIILLFVLTLASILLSVGLSLILAFSGRSWGRRTAHPQRVAHPTAAHPNLPPPLLQTYQIFISSSERDREWVTRFVEDLGTLGYLVWWYAKDAPGLPFGKEIRSAIFYTKLFLVVITPDSMASEHVEEEIRWADTFKRPIVPIEVRTTPVQDRHYGLAKGATIDFTDPREYDSALELLTQAITHHLTLAEQPATLTAPLTSTGPTAPSPASVE